VQVLRAKDLWGEHFMQCLGCQVKGETILDNRRCVDDTSQVAITEGGLEFCSIRDIALYEVDASTSIAHGLYRVERFDIIGGDTASPKQQDLSRAFFY
jgi:hypothetical protein